MNTHEIKPGDVIRFRYISNRVTVWVGKTFGDVGERAFGLWGYRAKVAKDGSVTTRGTWRFYLVRNGGFDLLSRTERGT